MCNRMGARVPRKRRKWRPAKPLGRSRLLSLRLESLEPRLVLGGLPTADHEATSPTWFESVPFVTTRLLSELPGQASGTAGLGWATAPGQPEADRWIVQLTADAISRVPSVRHSEHLLDTLSCDFQPIRGLGAPGQMLVQAYAAADEARAALAVNPNLAYFEADTAVIGPQDTLPNDEYFRRQTGLANTGQSGGTVGADIDAAKAWDITQGNTQVVVGVVDSGLDYTHADLYENVWINQGEIPAAIRSQLVDFDQDGLITFYDLNDHAPNRTLIADQNANGRIDGYDLLHDSRWADGADTDHNGYRDDLIGWDFCNHDNDPYDDHRHCTHVAGTIAAMSDNTTGVTGVAWQASLMPLKFLDQTNKGYTSDAVTAINYATMMRRDHGVNLWATNNSWGAGTDSSESLKAAKIGRAHV